MRGLVTPPLPFAGAERKADPNGPEHNTVPGKLPTAQSDYSRLLEGVPRARPGARRLRFGGLKPESAGGAKAERLFEFGQDGLEFGRKRPWRIDDQETGRGQAGLGGLRR